MRKTHRLEREIYEREAAICRAFANATRLRMLEALAEHECSTAELQRRLGLSSPNLSQHLRILRTAGLVMTHRRGNQMLCSLQIPEAKQASQTLRKMQRAQARHSRLWMPEA